MTFHKKTGWLRYLWYAFLFASLSTVIIVALVKHAHKNKHQGVGWSKSNRPKDSGFCDSALWTHDPDGVPPIDAFRHVSQASFEFPVSAHLVFTAEGEPALAHGTIEIDDSGEAGADTVNVDITAYSNNLRDLLDETKACQLTPTKNPVHGVGIYTNKHRPNFAYSYQRMVTWHIKVRLPAPSGRSPINITGLSTHMPMFVHHIGDIARSVHFTALSSNSFAVPISVQSLAAERVTVETMDGTITGTFNASRSLSLFTTNAPLKVDVGMLSSRDDGLFSTDLSIQTMNGNVTVSMHDNVYANCVLCKGPSLRTSACMPRQLPARGGVFEVGLKTSNSSLTIAMLDAPPDHILRMNAQTWGASANVVLPKTYEGEYHLRSPPMDSPAIHVADLEDPAGRGRRRVVEKHNVKGVIGGTIQWLPSIRNTHSGVVNIWASKLGMSLSL
ncbi:predicted protein [Postia placenta Mad-698-R]|uniref:Uncharacterized protein n=1 Tax=Postia placenta MAD-698-R-SB12 TaxID=670580 RepID=A0A1X6N876_9APHY|nr:hypothetical protein POSPLADRAFT_1133596 [Postia placenta MAD-698-R-SB12]EED79497.1 predicted protein [Postia placenta Mad-698-R]OSX64821.1 hypothetical protein POSPLADRAFT_1133596 [Postia placenta MAD-698-R-SB12]